MKGDVDLIKKMGEVLSLIPECHDFAHIIQEYKKDNNPDVAYHKLAEYEEKQLLSKHELTVEDLEEGLKEDKETVYYDYWVNIGENFACRIKHLQSFKTIDLWDNNRAIYAIRINEVNKDSYQSYYANTDIKFFSEHERDKEFLRVRRRLSAFTFIRFL